MFKIKFYSRDILVISLFFLFFGCAEQTIVLPSSTIENPSTFFKSRRGKDTNRKEVLKQSHTIYAGGKLCSSFASCKQTCNLLFSLDLDKKDCVKLPSLQIHRFEKVYKSILEKELSVLQEIDVFDLKVFLNLSPEPFLQVLQTLGPVSAKVFLNWITADWRVAKVFNEEDWDFLFFQIFLKEIQLSPINSLREEVAEGRTFVELAWLKQNDFALFWLGDYFQQVQCSKFNEEEAEIAHWLNTVC